MFTNFSGAKNWREGSFCHVAQVCFFLCLKLFTLLHWLFFVFFFFLIIFPSAVFTTPSSLIQFWNIVNQMYACSRALPTALMEILCCPQVPGGTEGGKDYHHLYWFFTWQVAHTALGLLCCMPAGKYWVGWEAALYFHKKHQCFKIFLHSALELKKILEQTKARTLHSK